MKLDLIWQSIRLNLRLHLAHPLGYAALGLLVFWAASVPSVGINRADFAARASELGYPPLSDSALAGLGAAQVASGFMTVCGVLLFLNNLERERGVGLDEVLASTPVPSWVLIVLQYLGNTATLALCTLIAYLVALVAYPFRELEGFSVLEFFWPGLLFPLGSVFLLASLPLVLDGFRVYQIGRGIAYGILVLLFNLGPFVVAAATYVDHPLHPMFQVWLTANQGLDTVGIWYVRGYLSLVLEAIEQLGTPDIPVSLWWGMVLRPRLVTIGVGLGLAACAAWRFDRFRPSPRG